MELWTIQLLVLPRILISGAISLHAGGCIYFLLQSIVFALSLIRQSVLCIARDRRQRHQASLFCSSHGKASRMVLPEF